MHESTLLIREWQGCGKTTLVEQLERLFEVTGERAASLSIDDFYLTFQDQQALSKARILPEHFRKRHGQPVEAPGTEPRRQQAVGGEGQCGLARPGAGAADPGSTAGRDEWGHRSGDPALRQVTE